MSNPIARLAGVQVEFEWIDEDKVWYAAWGDDAIMILQADDTTWMWEISNPMEGGESAGDYATLAKALEGLEEHVLASTTAEAAQEAKARADKARADEETKTDLLVAAATLVDAGVIGDGEYDAILTAIEDKFASEDEEETDQD